ncbi:MAG: hypothetical protein FWD61_02370 [Phycisphaerales bacterium]|nr:hypothetical protein [Phycisphaerales bacterium]
MIDFFSTFGPYDYALIVLVTLQATAVAYLHRPQLKALVFMLPIPFTCSALAVGKPIGVDNIAGLFLFLFYMFFVLILHIRFRVAIIPTILISALIYCFVGGIVRPFIPRGTLCIIVSSLAAVALVALLILRQMPPRQEPGQRTDLPIYLKIPILAAIVVALLSIKSLLGGFITLFPIMGMISAYEARNSLYTLTRHAPILILLLVPTISTIIVAQNYLPLPPALLAGWAVYLPLMFLFVVLSRSTPQSGRGGGATPSP